MPRVLRSRAPTPAIFRGSTTLSSTVALGVRKNCWNTNPKSWLRNRFSCRTDNSSALVLPTLQAPSSGWSNNASRCIRVDFTDPLLPTIAIDSPAYTDSATPANASNRAVPLP